MEARMKKLAIALLACAGLSSCVVVPLGRYEREVYVSPQPAATYYPTYSYRYYSY
jgi:hypothetical protein